METILPDLPPPCIRPHHALPLRPLPLFIHPLLLRVPLLRPFATALPASAAPSPAAHGSLRPSAASFCGVLTWTLALNNRENMGEAEEDSPKRSIDSDNRIDSMVFDAPNPEEVGMEDGLDV